MSQDDSTQKPDDGKGDTYAFPLHLLGELDAPAAKDVEHQISVADGSQGHSALLLVIRGANAGSRFLLEQPVTSVGRDPHSDIFLDDATVSRHHAEFRLEDGQHRIVDLDSLNNTYVNHEPIHSALLSKGDEIQIGKFRLVFLTRPLGK